MIELTQMSSSELIQFINCKILRNHTLIEEHLWVRNGKIINPEEVFFDEKIKADTVIDCNGCIIAPGFIDIQINGGFGVDFSNCDNIDSGLSRVAKNLLSSGVTSFCPTIVTSPNDVYKHVMPRIKRRRGGLHGATVLGIHLEGPFININKKGAHPPELIKDLDQGFQSLVQTYSTLENVSIITLAPELKHADEIIPKLSSLGITVSVGHSMASLKDGENAISSGASLITHLFNAMLPFHHRDPGLVGLLASHNTPQGKTVYFGIISDGIHTHPAALRIAYRIHPDGLVLVTDAVSAMGLQEGRHNIGQLLVEIKNGMALVAGTNTLCGSIATMDACVKIFIHATGCSIEYALEAASLHPAEALGIAHKKGTLNVGGDADFVFLDSGLSLLSTWIAGKCVYKK